VPELTSTWPDLAGDPVVGAEHRAERRRGVAEFEGKLHVLGQREAQSAVLGRERIPEQAHVRRGLADVGRDRVGVLDLVLARDDLVADEHPDRVKNVGELSSFHDRQVSEAGPRARDCRADRCAPTRPGGRMS
jgi:hypothetical protein